MQTTRGAPSTRVMRKVLQVVRMTAMKPCPSSYLIPYPSYEPRHNFVSIYPKLPSAFKAKKPHLPFYPDPSHIHLLIALAHRRLGFGCAAIPHLPPHHP